MAYTFFPKSASEIVSTLKAKNDLEKEKISEITKLFAFLKSNQKTKNLIDTPINIDPLKIGQVNISRKLKPAITELAIKNKVGFKKITIKFGDGSAGGRGVNNKGGKFEKDLGPAFKKWYAGTKITDTDLKYSIEETYNITDFKNFDKNTLEVNTEAGALNTKRPIQYSGNKIQLLSSSPDFDIGKMVTDITLKGKVNKKNKEVYLSLKTTSTVTFFNVGVKEVLTTEEIKKKNITNKNGLALLKMLNIDPAVFCDVYNQPKSFKGYSEEINLTSAKKEKLKSFLESGIGYGYTVVHQIKKGNVKVFNVTKNYMQAAADPQSMIVYYGGKSGSGKRVDIVIETKKYTLGLNIRDTQGKDGYPTRLMCNFSYK
jgi:hypothetical protein